jgi:competence protein ComEA
MRFRKFFDELFVLSKAERNGAFVLIVIILILIIVRFMLPMYYSNVRRNVIELDQRIIQLEKIRDSSKNGDQKFKKATLARFQQFAYNKKETVRANQQIDNRWALSSFDPNMVSKEELIRMGFPSNVVCNLISYREKGGEIRKTEDLKKIYGLDSVLYLKILPYIKFYREKNKSILIEINSADSATLTTLRGVGPVYAARICKYRNYLKGFVTIDQLKEVYKFPSETYNSIKDYLTLDSGKVEKININFADINELKNHPYSNFEIARKIVYYRSQKGYIQAVDKLMDDSVIDLSAYNRLAPYLKVK